jgi:hypothetical protein
MTDPHESKETTDEPTEQSVEPKLDDSDIPAEERGGFDGGWAREGGRHGG